MARLFAGFVNKINAQHPVTRTGDTRYRQQVYPGLSAEMFAGGHFVRRTMFPYAENENFLAILLWRPDMRLL